MKSNRHFLAILVLLLPIYLIAVEPVIHRLPAKSSSTFPLRTFRNAPGGDEIINPPEFGRSDGVFLAWAGWGNQLTADIANPISQRYQVYLLVNNITAQAQAYVYLQNQDVNMQNVHFIIDSNVNNTSMWIRDYAPFFIKNDGEHSIVNVHYGGNINDSEIAYNIAETFDLPFFESPMMHHGGNHMTDGNGMGFFSTNIYLLNSAFTQAEIDAEFKNYFGLDSLIVIQPMAGDGTGHIDMFCKLLDDTTFIIGEYDEDTYCYPGDRELLNSLAEQFSSMTNLDGRPFQVERIPMPPYTYGGPAGTINYTYTNSLIINDLVLVPVYGFETDATALGIYQNLMPNHTIIGIDSSYIIQYWGAIHCVTSEYFSENPLIILHEKITQIEQGEEPLIEFRLNPKFVEANASVYIKPVSENQFTEFPAVLESGLWSVQLPATTESFHYYLSGTATSGDYTFSTTLPETAPYDTYYVENSSVFAENITIQPIVNLFNHPNPFNPSTTISFHLLHSGKVTVSVYNTKGQMIKTLAEREMEKGTQALIWNGDNDTGKTVSSGVYLYQVAIDGVEAAVNKCLLMK